MPARPLRTLVVLLLALMTAACGATAGDDAHGGGAHEGGPLFDLAAPYVLTDDEARIVAHLVGADGRGMSIWLSRDENDVRTLYGRAVAGGTRFGPSIELAQASQIDLSPLVPLAIAANGDAVVAWRAYDGNQHDAYLRHYEAATDSWSDPVPLETSPEHAQAPVVSIRPDGVAAAVWQVKDGTDIHVVEASTYARQDGLGPVVPLGLDDQNTFFLRLAQSPNGHAVVAWDGGDPDEIHAARYTPADGWEPAERIDRYTQISRLQDVAITDAGHAAVVWRNLEVAPDADALVFARFDPEAFGAGWQEPELLEAATVIHPDVRVIDVGEDLVFAYRQSVPGDRIVTRRWDLVGGPR